MTKDFKIVSPRLICLLTLCLILPGPSLFGQDQKISFEEVRNQKGRSLGKVNAMVQDKKGFMWFSDQSNGTLVRYDGSNMTFYGYEPDNPNSLGGPYPECLWVSDSGIIWIGFVGYGLDRFDPVSHSFTHFRHDPENPESLGSDIVWALLEDNLGNIWVGTDKGLDLLDPKQGTFRHFRYDEKDPVSLSHDEVRSLYEDRSGTLWVGTGFAFNTDTDAGGLNRFDRASETFTRYLHNPGDSSSLISNKIRAILEDSHGNFWVGTDGNGLHTMDRETGQFTRYTYNPEYPHKLGSLPVIDNFSHITFLIEDVTGHIWIGTLDNGLIRYDPATESVTHFGTAIKNSTAVLENDGWDAYLRSDSGWCALPAEDGLVWLGTQVNPDLFRIDLYSSNIPYYQYPAMSGWTIPTFFEDSSGLFWKGNGDGLVLEDSTGVTLKVYQHDPENSNTLSNTDIRAISEDHTGRIWVGTASGLNAFDPAGGGFVRYLPDPENPASLSAPVITSVFEDSKQRLWVGTYGGGLNALNQEQNTFRVYKHDPDNPNSISGLNISTICEDKNGDLWIGLFEEGHSLNRLNPSDGTFTPYLRGLNVYSLLVDARDQLWAGTHLGLYKYNEKQDRFEHAGISYNITLVIDDVENNLWLYTSDGIIKYNPENGNTLVYGENNAVKGIKEPAAVSSPYRKRDGSILFGRLNGYYAFYPESLWVSRDTTRLYITDFRVNRGDQLSAEQVARVKSPGEDSLFLNYSQRDFSLSFTTIDFRNTEGGQISYMLENFDPDWLEGNADIPANYFRVPGRVYFSTESDQLQQWNPIRKKPQDHCTQPLVGYLVGLRIICPPPGIRRLVGAPVSKAKSVAFGARKSSKKRNRPCP